MVKADPDWHLQEWASHFGKRQAHLVAECGFTKNQAHNLWHGKQPYRREIVNRVSQWLKIQPHELLMTPEEALAYRGLRESALAIAAGQNSARQPQTSAPTPRRPDRLTGTNG